MSTKTYRIATILGMALLIVGIALLPVKVTPATAATSSTSSAGHNGAKIDRLEAKVAELKAARTDWMRTPCEFEDSTNCYWDASTDGLANGGHSFYDFTIGKTRCIAYVQPKFAHHHNRCTTA